MVNIVKLLTKILEDLKNMKNEVYRKADYVYLNYEDFLNTTRTPHTFLAKGVVALTRELDAPEIQEYCLLSTPAFRLYDTNNNEVANIMYSVRYAFSNASDKHMYVRVDFYNPSDNNVSVKNIVMNYIGCPY